MKFSLLVSLFNIFLGTIITLSSSSWISMWLGMELNLLGFIPLLIQKNNPFSNEMSMKYFLIQAITSSIFIMSTTLLYNSMHLINYFTTTLIIFALAMKIAMAPMHFWLPPLIETMAWPLIMLLLTWQKIAPLIIMLNFPMNQTMFFIMASTIIGPIMMFNQTSLKKLLLYSSISHLAWIFSSSLLNIYLSSMYFTIYMLNTIATTVILYKYNITYMNQTLNISHKLKMPLLTNLLSLGGFPPLLGFLPKMITIMNMIKYNNFIPLSILLMMSAIISLFSYIRISYNMLMTPPLQKKLSTYYKQISFLILIPFLSFLFPLIN